MAAERTVVRTTSTTTGTVLKGAVAVTITDTGGSGGTVQGTALVADGSFSVSAPQGDTLGAIKYDATGTTFTIETLY